MVWVVNVGEVVCPVAAGDDARVVTVGEDTFVVAVGEFADGAGEGGAVTSDDVIVITDGGVSPAVVAGEGASVVIAGGGTGVVSAGGGPGVAVEIEPGGVGDIA